MSDKPTSDIVMKFVDKDGNPVWAESTLSVLKADPFMAGFEPIGSYDEYSNFFEVTTFNYNITVKPDDENVGAMSQHGSAVNAGFPGRPPAAQDQFSRWRSAKNDEYKKMKFPIEFDTFTFTRIIDGASPAFFRACCYQESFKTAALVRRVATGVRGGTERSAAGFLRLDFKDVLITSISWDDGELVTENVEFICKHLQVRYRQQQADSSLLSPTEAIWDQDRDGTSKRGGSS